MEPKDILFALLRSEILDEALIGEVTPFLTADLAAEVLRLAQKHDLGHVAAAALVRSHALDSDDAATDEVKEKSAALRKICDHLQMTAAFRYERMRFALDEISRVLADAGIPYMPLKGAVLRDYYRVPWHRSSCDIDVLVHEEDLDRACEALVSQAGYKVDGEKNFHDIHLYSPADIHLELHFSLLSGNEKLDGLLGRVWEHSRAWEDGGLRFVQSSAFFLYHHVAHMAYHFSSGGCGIKPFLDLFIMQKNMRIDMEAASALLAEAGLETFYSEMLALSAVWFGDGAHTEMTRKIEAFVLSGGVYGTVDNKVLVQQSRRGGKLRYALSRIFISRASLTRVYPVLERHPWLLPVMQVRRWVRLVFTGGLRRGVRELSVNQRITGAQASDAESFMSSLGL